jgi:hypothetical protein
MLDACLWVSFLGKNSVKTFSGQRTIVRGVVFYAVRVVSQERERLVLYRTFYLFGRQMNMNRELELECCVEAGSNTSTVSLRVVGGDEKGTQCLGV